MNLLKKGIEYQNLAKGFNGVFVMLNELEIEIEKHNSDDFDEFKQDICFLAYLCRKDILDRMEEYNWEMNTPIIVPMISMDRVTLTFAYHNTIARLKEIAERIDLIDDVEKVLIKKGTYFMLHRLYSDHIRNQ